MLETLRKNSFILLIFFFAIFTSCSVSEDKHSVADTKETVENAVAPEGIKKTVLLIGHKVKDFTFWKEGFDKQGSTRKEYGITDMNVFRATDDTNYVAAMMLLNDIEAARKYATSHGLKEMILKYGVISDPNIKFLDSYQPTANFYTPTRLIVSHQVLDYDKWNEGFGKQEPVRIEYGLHVLNVFRANMNPNEITVLFGVDDIKTAQLYAYTMEFQKILQDYGVVSELEARFFNVAD